MSKYIQIFYQVIILFLYSFTGKIIVETLGINFPGSILGLLMLFISLYFKIIPVSLISSGAGFLLGIMPLLFIPSTVGVMNFPEFFSLHGFLLVVIVILSTIITIAVSGRVCQYIESKESIKESI